MIRLLASSLLLFVTLPSIGASAEKQVQATANLPTSEINALYDLYNSTQGWNWLWKPLQPRWVFGPTANPCTGHWQGITCVLPSPHTYYYVSEIGLSEYHLVGPLPSSIGSFGHLTQLDLSKNRINGTIPSTIGQLTSLAALLLPVTALTGGLPESLCQLRNLGQLAADSTKLGGTIPNCFGMLQSMQNMTLSNSALTGTIPASLSNITTLQRLLLGSNYLVGAIPSSIGEVTSLRQFVVTDNYLTGAIPPKLVQLPDLWYLDLSVNGLNGSLPAFTNEATKIAVLILEHNSLSGSLPPSIQNLRWAVNLALDSNLLSGTLPESLGQLKLLRYLEVAHNRFSGSLPESLASLYRPAAINVEGNRLTGTIPDAFGNLTSLTEFIIQDNFISGTIPASFGQLRSMQLLGLNYNFLTGSIPSGLGNWEAVIDVVLTENLLTGSIPAGISKLTLLTVLDLGYNYLTGSLPADIGNLTSCQYFVIPFNLLDGPLPISFGKMEAMIEVEANGNLLTGQLPPLTNLAFLNLILLPSNRFTGTLAGVFNASTQRALQTISVQDNQLTGTLPAEVFRLPALQTFVAISNCFHGTIPEDVCNATALNSLVLDGLSSATSCRRTLPSGAYLLSRSVGGTVPQCLFQLATLVTLHLSGNTFSGSLPSLEVLSDALVDLSVSHNQLSGTIPAVFQQRRWYNFDVSYNFLTGSLRSDFRSGEIISNQSSVSLENNRLSGRIPGALQTMQNVSVLGTNLFECNLAGSDLPQHDSGRSNYECGSTSFDIPYYLWLCAISPVVMFALWRWRRPLSANSYQVTLTRLVTSWYVSSQRVAEGRQVLPGLMHVLDTLCLTSTYCAVYVTVILLPAYLLLSHYYGTLTYSYAWTASAAFLSGAVPVAVELPLWMLLMCIVLWAVHRALPKAAYFALPARSTSTTKRTLIGVSVEVRNRAIIRTLFVLIDLVVVVGVNVLYVYIAIYQSSALLVLAQVLMSFFKLLWNGACMDAMLRFLVSKLAPELVGGDRYAQAYRTEFLSLHLFVSLLNSIAIPCLVVAGVSPNCFYNVFQPAPEVRSLFAFLECYQLDSNGVCESTRRTVESAIFDAPFSYTYQCSSSLITYYAPAYINLCIIAGFLTPVGHAVCEYVRQRTPQGYAARVILELVVPRILKPAPAVDDTEENLPYVQANQLLITIVTYLGALLTFGTVLPPLGVALAVTVAMVVLFTKLKIGRLLCSAGEQGQLDKFVRILEQQCEGAGSASFLQSALWMLLTLSCLFYTLFLFDTLGDAVGFRGALWVLIVVPLMPLALYGTYSIYLRGWPEPRNGGLEDAEKSNVELSVVVSGSAQADADTYNAIVVSAGV